MSRTVRTVLGDVSSDDLGLTLSHEHLIAKPPPGAGRDDDDWTLDDDDRALAELDDFAAGGGRSLVDMTPIGYGRDVSRLATLSRRAGVRIVACTGLHRTELIPPDIRTLADETLVELFVRDLQAVAAPAGLLKAATGPRFTPMERRAFRCVATASLRTGASIATHTEAGALAVEQMQALLDAGVPAARVAIGHLHGRTDRGVLRVLAEAGGWIGIDNWSHQEHSTDAERVAVISWLLDRGWTRILVSGDLGRRRRLRAYGGSPGYSGVISALSAMLPADVVQLLGVVNPASFLAMSDAISGAELWPATRQGLSSQGDRI